MRNSTRIALIVAACCIVALAVWFMQPASANDTDQINSQITTAINGADQRSAATMMSIISPNYQDDNGFNTIRLQYMLSRSLRGASTLNVTASQPVITVTGDSATSDCDLSVNGTDSGGGKIALTQPLHLTWRKEHAHRLLVFPTTVWRVVGAQYSASGMDVDQSQ